LCFIRSGAIDFAEFVRVIRDYKQGKITGPSTSWLALPSQTVVAYTLLKKPGCTHHQRD
jgi:hypothetical protein